MSDQVINEAQAKHDDATVTSIEPKAFGSFAGGVTLTFATRLLMLVGVVGSSVIVARRLGPEGFGALAVLTATVALAVQIGSAGLPSANVYFVSRDRKRLGPVWANSLAFAFGGGAMLVVIVVTLGRVSPALFGDLPVNLVLVAAIAIPFQLLNLLGLNVLLAMDRIGQMNFLDSMLPALILLNAIVVLFVLHAGLPVLVSFNSAAAFVLAIWMMMAIGRLLSRQYDAQPFRPNVELFQKTIRYGLKFSVPVMAAILVFRVDLLILNHFRGAAEAGVYAVASQVANLLLMMPGVIATLLFPRLASYQDQRGEFAIRVTRHASFVMLIMCAAAAAGSFLLPLIYGPRFADATIQLLILLPGVYLVGIESVLVQHFSGIGLPVAIPIFWVVTLAVNVGLNLVLVPAFGGRGAAYASVISYALIFVLVVFYFRVKTGNQLSAIFLLRRRELRDLFATIRSGSKASIWTS
jgi:O-antigen/teichoic acid export membrane protein